MNTFVKKCLVWVGLTPKTLNDPPVPVYAPVIVNRSDWWVEVDRISYMRRMHNIYARNIAAEAIDPDVPDLL